MSKISAQKDILNWTDYRQISIKLNDKYPYMDILLLKRQELIKLVMELDNFDDPSTSPNQLILDDIRFAWFFLQKGNNETTTGLRASF